MVSRKINELQLQREQPECQRLRALTPPQWQRRALLVPSAASHPTTAMPTLPLAHGLSQPSPFLTVPLHLSPLEPTWDQPGQPRHPPAQNGAVPGWQVQVTAQRRVPHTSATLLPTRPGSWQPLCAQHAWGQSLRPSVISFQRPPHPYRDRHSIFQQHSQQGLAGPKATPCNPWQAGTPGHPQPAAPPPGCSLPRGHWQQGWSGREEGAPAVAQASRELNMNSRAV